MLYIYCGDIMNNLEVIRLINTMVNKSRVASIYVEVTSINSRLSN